MANIRLNILPVSESDFSFKVFRKLKQEDDTKEDNIYFYHLPEDSDLTKRKVIGCLSYQDKVLKNLKIIHFTPLD